MGEPDPAEGRPIPPGRLRSYKREQELVVDKQWFGDDAGQDLIEASLAPTQPTRGAFPGLYPFGTEPPPLALDPTLPAATLSLDAPPLPPPVPPHRYLNARSPARVERGERTYVLVQAAVQAARSSTDDAAAAKSIDGFSGELTVDVHAPGLKAEGPLTQTLTVPTSGDSAPLRFSLVATTPGVQRIEVMAWNGSALVAGLTLEVAVGVAAGAEGSEAQATIDVRAPSSGEYTLDLAWEPDGSCYRFQLRSDQHDVWPPMRSEPLLGDRQVTYQRTLALLNAQARNLYRLEPADQAQWLRGLGTLLFEQLVPEALQALLVAQRPRIKVLNILSPPDSTPWELLYIADPNGAEGGDFLASGTTVARWRYGSAPERTLRATSPYLVLPSGAPPQAQEELVKLRHLVGKDAGTIEDIGSLNALLNRGDFGLLHFAAHNVAVPDALAGAYVPFGPQRWDLTMLVGVPVNRFRRRQPLIFMNACTTSGTTQVYTELSNWADRFLKCGAGAFIGTLWEVRDGSARYFSQSFYERLIGGGSIGEAMQSARQALRAKNEGDPTPLAYTLYGNPHARWEAST